jgi:hypothetical protein
MSLRRFRAHGSCRARRARPPKALRFQSRESSWYVTAVGFQSSTAPRHWKANRRRASRWRQALPGRFALAVSFTPRSSFRARAPPFPRKRRESAGARASSQRRSDPDSRCTKITSSSLSGRASGGAGSLCTRPDRTPRRALFSTASLPTSSQLVRLGNCGCCGCAEAPCGCVYLVLLCIEPLAVEAACISTRT